MLFSDGDTNVEITIVGYEFSADVMDYDDKNWLLVRCCYERSATTLCREDPALKTTDLISLKEWISAIKNNTNSNERLEFLENTIEFFIENNQLIADLCFELSRDFECHQYSLNISNKSMKTLINELDFYLDKFPERK